VSFGERIGRIMDWLALRWRQVHFRIILPGEKGDAEKAIDDHFAVDETGQPRDRRGPG